MNDLDSLISTELSDLNLDKDFFDIMTAHMVHGPCGSGFNILPFMNTKVVFSF